MRGSARGSVCGNGGEVSMRVCVRVHVWVWVWVLGCVQGCAYRWRDEEGRGTVVAFRGICTAASEIACAPAGTDMSFYQDGECELIGALRECEVCACVIDGCCCL